MSLDYQFDNSFQVEYYLLNELKKDLKCSCGYPYLLGDLEAYPHPNGLTLMNGQKLWFYFHCRICSYDMALWKLGVDAKR